LRFSDFKDIFIYFLDAFKLFRLYVI